LWVVFELAARPDYLKQLREEVFSHVDPATNSLEPSNTGEAVQKAIWLDSFIRKVLRTKGDTLSTCGLTTADVLLGGYTIPQGQVLPLATLVHLSPVYHPDPSVFRPERWHRVDGRPAVMSSPSYIPFGLGRWSSCPGRILAVSGAW
ncbi:putative cytochrome P450, partial [Mycena latifolia]